MITYCCYIYLYGVNALAKNKLCTKFVTGLLLLQLLLVLRFRFLQRCILLGDLVLNAVQGVHADIYMYHNRGEVSGTCRSKAPQVRCLYVFPASQKMITKTAKNAVECVAYHMYLLILLSIS